MSSQFVKVLIYVAVCAASFAGLSRAKFLHGHRVCLPQVSHQGMIAEGGTDILLMGSSLARMGYDPRVLEKGTGRQAYVVAYNGMGPAYLHVLLEHLLEDAGVKPSLLVIEGSVLTTSIPPGIRDRNLFFNAPPELKRRLLKRLAEQPGGLRFRQWYDLVVAAKNQDIVCHPLTAGALEKLFYHGAHMQAPESALTQAQFANVAPYPTDLEPFDNHQIFALHEIFKLVRKHHVRTVFVAPAVPAPLYQIPVIREKQDKLANLFIGQGFEYIDGTRGFPNDDPANYFDGRHFSARGRTLFSEFFVEKLRERGIVGDIERRCNDGGGDE